MSTTLVLGGARSGKSAYAERLAHASGKEVVYVATSPTLDGKSGLFFNGKAEMRANAQAYDAAARARLRELSTKLTA